MRLRTTVRAAMGTAFSAVAIAGTLAAGQPASAVAAYYSLGDFETCASGYTCLYYSLNRDGGGVGFYNDAWNLATIPSAYSWIDNQSQSAQNHSNSGNVTKLYNNAGGSGSARCLRAGQYVSAFPSAIDQKVSALVWAGSCGSVTQF